MTRHLEDDEPTGHELTGEVTHPSYEHAPPTLEMRPSPFHPMASATPTAPGMPSPFAPLEPVITSMPAGVAILPPRIVGAPEGDMAGPTDPDGYPLPESWEPSAEEAPWIDSGPTDVSAAPRMMAAPPMPPPDAPKVEVSESLMLESEEVQEAVRAAKARSRANKRRPRHHVPQEGPGAAAPTYQMLPALKRKQAKEGSDWPLIAGLLALALVIAGVIGVGAYFATRSLGGEPPAAGG